MSENPSQGSGYPAVSQPYPGGSQEGGQPGLVNGFLRPDELCPVDQQPHVFKHNLTTTGLIWAIVCFPCGLICCMKDAESKCVKCNKLGMGPAPKWVFEIMKTRSFFIRLYYFILHLQFWGTIQKGFSKEKTW
jgi:hypothetical protein